MTHNDYPRCPACGHELATNGMRGRLNCPQVGCLFGFAYLTPEQWAGVRYVNPEEKPKARRMRECKSKYHCDHPCAHREEHDYKDGECEDHHVNCPGPCRPVDPTPTEPEWYDITIDSDGITTYVTQQGELRQHALAVSEPGFMGYVYDEPNKGLSCDACRVDAYGKIDLPIAWRRRIEKKGGA